MTIDWQKVAASYERDLLTDLKALIAIPSVRDVEHKTAEAPLGPAPAQALNAMLEIAKRDGFDTLNVENVAGRISFGQGDTKLGLLGHVDVVPAGEGWDSEPFVAKIQDGRIYGRGSADDKGPTLAAYYALRLLKDQGITPKQTVQFIIGTDEESNWYGMDRYQATQPMPDYGFSPDAEFPIINGEKGISTLTLTFAAQPTSGHTSMTAFDAGLRVNMVPQSATASLTGNLPDDWQAQSDAYAQANNVKISYADTADGVQFSAVGFGAHALEPSAGINAATHLATLLAPWVDDPAGHLYLQTIADHLHNDSRGHHLDIAFSDAIMGDLTASADLFTFRPNGEQTIAINVRYPQGIDLATIQAKMQQALGDAVTVSITEAGHTPHYVSGDDPLVKTLLQVYQEHTGHDGREQSIGGGTYGRIMKRGVAFGAMMPGRENVMHQANEYMPIEDIMHAVAIYADAIYRLTQTEAL